MDFSVLKRAGMSQLEFSRLALVSRVTANTWVTGKMQPHRYIKPRIARVLLALEAAVNNADLPISPSTPIAKRGAALKRALLSGALSLKEVG